MNADGKEVVNSGQIPAIPDSGLCTMTPDVASVSEFITLHHHGYEWVREKEYLYNFHGIFYMPGAKHRS